MSRHHQFGAALVGVLAFSFPLKPLPAGEVVLKNGTVLSGTPMPITQLPVGPAGANGLPTTVYPILMVSNDLAQYFVPSRQVVSAERGAEIQRLETFRLEQPNMVRTKTVAGLGGFLEIQPFDDFGRRSVTLSTGNGALPVIQGITQITAEHARVEGLNVFWRTGLATSSISQDRLDAILHKAISRNNPDERLKVVRFYIQAQLFDRAQAELDTLQDDFPELKERCAEVGLQLAQLRAQMILDELKLRQEAGQHRLAYTFVQKFPTKDVSASLLKDVREFQEAFDARREQAEKVVSLLGELQAGLRDSAQSAEVAPLRAEIAERLHPDNLERLDAFLKLSNAPNLSAAEKLALALSGWVVGSSNAVTDLPQALNLWRARFQIREFLRTARDAAADREQILERLKQIEGIGPKTVAQILPLMPPFLETPDAAPGVPYRVQVTAPKDEHPVAYHVLLPLEYHPERSYPLIVSLHGIGREPQSELEFWGKTAESPGQSQRHGYIVIAPEYLEGAARSYDYTADSYRVVLESLYDARRRFHVDSDRVFLAGHGAGGDAVFDLAMAHPDVFAGAIPMGGVSEKICKHIWKNGKNISWYVLVGELDRGSISQNPRDVSRMILQGFDVIYAQYLGGGADSFYAEIHRLFDWMSRSRRRKYEKGQPIEYLTLRNCDTHIHWLSFEGLPPAVVQSDWSAERGGKVNTMTVKSCVTEGNTLWVDSRAVTHTVYLSPDFVDFEKRLQVRLNNKVKSNDYPKSDVGIMLEDFHRRADRQRICWAAISF